MVSYHSMRTVEQSALPSFKKNSKRRKNKPESLSMRNNIDIKLVCVAFISDRNDILVELAYENEQKLTGHSFLTTNLYSNDGLHWYFCARDADCVRGQVNRLQVAKLTVRSNTAVASCMTL